ncbi:alpha/beta hydrolase [Sphingomonas morindae]|uniref:Alpha/beta hydrolase n=1 Tax=Sphingomonas morindae TaxID=1541170 RepID=A0ABY4X7B6_9SPHN|nr:alpha/beta hydrolase [Sphingomonas morindae]USI72824.1 alpha/beta hydrolase [Sphingomonas morindae]
MICSSLNLVFFTSVSSRRRTLAQTGGVSGEHVRHSWGGAVITEVGDHEKVKALDYVAAFAPAAGETLGELVNAHPTPPALAEIRDDGTGNLKLSVEGWIKDVAQDLPEAEARLLAVLQPPLPGSTFAEPIKTAAWESRPSWYIVSHQDRVVSVDLERMFAQRMNAQTSELEAGHLSLLSQPEAVAAVIVQAAENVPAG